MPCQLMVGFFAHAKSLDIRVDKEELEGIYHAKFLELLLHRTHSSNKKNKKNKKNLASYPIIPLVQDYLMDISSTCLGNMAAE